MKPNKEEAETIVEEVVEEAEAKEGTPTEEDEEAETSTEEESTEEPPVVGYPVFLTQADINKMIYENNQMLRLIVESIQKQ